MLKVALNSKKVGLPFPFVENVARRKNTTESEIYLGESSKQKQPEKCEFKGDAVFFRRQKLFKPFFVAKLINLLYRNIFKAKNVHIFYMCLVTTCYLLRHV